VACLRASGRRVYAIPDGCRSLSRPARRLPQEVRPLGRRCPGDILQTGAELHRPSPDGSDLARAQQDAVWDCTRAHNRLRSHLCEYYPAIFEAFAEAVDA
jgi:hypothetical protein